MNILLYSLLLEIIGEMAGEGYPRYKLRNIHEKHVVGLHILPIHSHTSEERELLVLGLCVLGF